MSTLRDIGRPDNITRDVRIRDVTLRDVRRCYVIKSRAHCRSLRWTCTTSNHRPHRGRRARGLQTPQQINIYWHIVVQSWQRRRISWTSRNTENYSPTWTWYWSVQLDHDETNYLSDIPCYKTWRRVLTIRLRLYKRSFMRYAFTNRLGGPVCPARQFLYLH